MRHRPSSALVAACPLAAARGCLGAEPQKCGEGTASADRALRRRSFAPLSSPAQGSTAHLNAPGEKTNARSSFATSMAPQKSRRTLWWIVGAVVAVAVILGAVLGGVLGSRAADDNSNKSNAAVNAAADGAASSSSSSNGSGSRSSGGSSTATSSSESIGWSCRSPQTPETPR